MELDGSTAGPSGVAKENLRLPRHGRQGLSQRDRQSLRFRRQWVISRSGDRLPLDWPWIDLTQGLVLQFHPDTRVRHVISTTAARPPAGAILLGIGISTTTPLELLDQTLAELACNEHRRTERFLHGLAGTYVLLIYDADGSMLYTDPAAMMPIFRGHGRVASSPTLLGALERDAELDRMFPFGPHNDWYPGTLTPFVGVTAVPANHALDLGRGTLQRFWPQPDAAAPTSEPSIERIGDLLRTVATGTLEWGAVRCSLTGGKDSRLNLAALRDRRDDVQFFTIRGPTVKPCDVELSGMLAASFGLHHEFVDHDRPEPWLLELYDEMTAGLSIGGRRQIIDACSRLAGADVIHLNGNLGALAKSYFWHNRSPRTVTRTTLTREFTRTPARIQLELHQWLRSVPDLPPPTVYNLMYLEQRGGRWAAVGENASTLFYDSVAPLNSREIFEAICGLDVAEQHGGRLLVDLVGMLWPELLDVPYCRSTRKWTARVPRRLKASLKRLTGSAH